MAKVCLAHLYNRGRRSRTPSHQPNMSNCCVLGCTLSRYKCHSPLCNSIQSENFPLLVVSLLLLLNVGHQEAHTHTHTHTPTHKVLRRESKAQNKTSQ